MALFLLSTCPTFAVAAPMDEFLTALPGHEPWHGEVEIGYDLINSRVDLLKLREGNEDKRGETIGDYSGIHIRGGLALTKRLSADAALWKRGLETPYDAGESIAWQGALQYQATFNIEWLPAIALRLSSWGDSADDVLKGSETRLFDQDITTARRMRVEDPEDLQFQGDIIASWMLFRNTLLSTFLGMGKSKVDFGGAFAEPKHTPEGCEYAVSASSRSPTAFQLDPVHEDCGGAITWNGTAPIPEGLHISYDASYIQLGASLQWFNEQWRSRLGYRFQKWDRDALDDAILLYQHADKTVYDTNHHVTAEIAYKVWDRTAVFLRGQMMQHHFVGDVPYSYNLYSSHKFRNRYGFMTFGIHQGF